VSAVAVNWPLLFVPEMVDEAGTDAPLTLVVF